MLLSKSTMGGLHAELFTFCLYRELQQTELRTRISPLTVWYEYSKDSYNPPSLVVRFQTKDRTTDFFITHDAGVFVVQVLRVELDWHSELKNSLAEAAEDVPHAGPSDWLRVRCPRENMMDVLEIIASSVRPFHTPNSQS